MIIAIDYDNTFTADPQLWRSVLSSIRDAGHESVCITGRSKPPEAHEPEIPAKVICCRHGEFKRHAAARHGIAIDVWIDDMPGTIEPQRLLTFEDSAGIPE